MDYNNSSEEINNDEVSMENAYEDFSDYDMYYQVDKMNITETEFEIFPPCTAALTVLIVSFLIYILVCSALPKDVFKYLAMQHLLTGYLHVLCVTLYHYFLPLSIYSTIILFIATSLDLVLTYTTSCIAWIVFLRLYLFKDGEDLYTITGVTVFSSIFLCIIKGYEMLMNAFDDDSFLVPTLRLTSILLIMCISFSVLCITLLCVLSTLVNISVPQSIFAIFHISLLLLSDITLLRFNFDSGSNLDMLWSSLLFIRLVVEVIWYFVHDQFLYKIVF